MIQLLTSWKKSGHLFQTRFEISNQRFRHRKAIFLNMRLVEDVEILADNIFVLTLFSDPGLVEFTKTTKREFDFFRVARIRTPICRFRSTSRRSGWVSPRAPRSSKCSASETAPRFASRPTGCKTGWSASRGLQEHGDLSKPAKTQSDKLDSCSTQHLRLASLKSKPEAKRGWRYFFVLCSFPST